MIDLRSIPGLVHENTGIPVDFQSKLLSTLILAIVLYSIYWVVHKIAVGRIQDTRLNYRWRKVVAYIFSVLAIFMIGRIWFEGFNSIATFLGLVSAGMAIALKDPVVGLAAWFFILWRRPFGVGDRISVGNYKGDVIDQRLFTFTLMEVGNWVDAEQGTGRVVYIPNGKVFSEEIANYSQGIPYIWHEIGVLVTFESDWKKAKAILKRIGEERGLSIDEASEAKLRSTAAQMMIYFSSETPTVYTTVKDSGIMLTIRLLCNPRKRRATNELVWEDILDAFANEDDIDFAYPSQRMFLNLLEGKTGTLPPAEKATRQYIQALKDG